MEENSLEIIKKCEILLDAYVSGKLGQTKMPEDSNPRFSKEQEDFRLIYFTLPMALNYQRDSYKLWESTLKTFQDSKTKVVFDIKQVSQMDKNKLRDYLLKHKIALQPNKHPEIWKKISQTIFSNWGSIKGLIKYADYDFLKLKGIIQGKYKKGFPYLSGPKIFNYWSFIIQEYGGITLKNSEFIEIAPDTHITKASIKLGVITPEESESFSKEKISERWRNILQNSKINPIDMHPPLWFWSRNRFIFEI